jgi:hypothetical protein
MSEKMSVKQQVLAQEDQQTKEENPSNKGYSFIVGICIGIAIIVLFVFLFPN